MVYRLFVKISEEERNEQAKEQWLTMLPFMALKWIKFMSLSEYTDQVTGQNMDLRSNEEILLEVAQVRKDVYGGDSG